MVFIIYMFIYLQFSFHSYLLKSELMSSIFSTNMTYGTLLRVHSLISFLFLFPFMVANFVYIYGQSTGICGAFTNVTAMNLDLWITQDAYIKLAVLAMNIFFASVSR